MTVRVERTFELSASPDRVWQFIADPAQRARAISVVESYAVDPSDDRRATWQIKLPIPVIRKTVTVRTEDVVRDPPNRVKFVGTSKVMSVTGEHRLEPVDGGCRLLNEFVVEGKLPGVERFFSHNLDAELENLEAALREDLGVEAR